MGFSCLPHAIGLVSLILGLSSSSLPHVLAIEIDNELAGTFLNETWGQYANRLCSTLKIDQAGTVHGSCCDGLLPVVLAVDENGNTVGSEPLDVPLRGTAKYAVLPREQLKSGWDDAHSTLRTVVMWNPFTRPGTEPFQREIVKLLQEMSCKYSQLGQPIIFELQNVGWERHFKLFTHPRGLQSLPKKERPDIFFADVDDAWTISHRNLGTDLLQYLRAMYHVPNVDKVVSAVLRREPFGYFNDFFTSMGNKWKALPFMASISRTLYNKTTFARFGVKPPETILSIDDLDIQPSNTSAAWGLAAAIETLKQLAPHAEKEGKKPLDYPTWRNGEWSLLLIGIADYVLTHYTKTGNEPDTGYRCDMTSPKLIGYINKTFGELVGNNLIDDSLPPSAQQQSNQWEAAWPETSERDGHFMAAPPFTDQELSDEIWGIRLTDADGPPPDHPEIGIASPPGYMGLFSGYGLVISSATENQDISWDVIYTAASWAKPYMRAASLSMDMSPAYYGAETWYPWNTTDHHKLVFLGPYGYGIVPDYAMGPPPYPSEIKQTGLMRHMLWAMLKKNATAEEAAAHVCGLMDHVMTPKCTFDRHLQYAHSPCNDHTGTLTVHFDWLAPQTVTIDNPVCRDDDGELPEPIEIECSYPGSFTPLVITITVFSILGIILSGVFGLFVWKHRTDRLIKNASPFFLGLFLLGAIFMYLSLPLLAGSPMGLRLPIGLGFLFMGICLAFSSLLAKLARIYICFAPSRVKSLPITDQVLLLPVFLCMVIELALLLAAELTNGPFHTTREVTFTITSLEGYTRSYSIPTLAARVSVTSPAFLGVAIFSMLLVGGACGVSFQIYKVPSQYQEAKLIAVIVYLTGLLCVCIGPMVAAVDSATARYSLVSVSLFLGITVAVCVMFVPKLQSYMGQAKNQISKQISKRMAVNIATGSRSQKGDSGMRRGSVSDGNIYLAGAGELINHTAVGGDAKNKQSKGQGEIVPPRRSENVSCSSHEFADTPEIAELDRLTQEVDELERKGQELEEKAIDRRGKLLALANEKGVPMDGFDV